jgi:hypothetical protein
MLTKAQDKKLEVYKKPPKIFYLTSSSSIFLGAPRKRRPHNIRLTCNAFSGAILAAAL